jgi:dolichol-phosphate mannosyltransferase
MSSCQTISVVIPCCNEAENCPALVDGVVGALAPLKIAFEIIVVDDGSTDPTIPTLRLLQHKVPELRILCHAKNCGQSTALVTGIRAARHPVIATLDGDGQNEPADIPALLHNLHEHTNEGVQMVIGWRQRRQDTFWRRGCSRIANRIRSGLLRDATPDTGCGLKVFYRDHFLTLPYFNHMHRFLPALIQRQGGRVLSLPVQHHARKSGRSHYGTLDRLVAGVFDLIGVLWLIRRSRHTSIKELSTNHEQQ